MTTTRCAECGMYGDPREYHPMAMCVLFREIGDSTLARAYVRGVLAYGMRAQQLGVSADDAMQNIAFVTSEDSHVEG